MRLSTGESSGRPFVGALVALLAAGLLAPAAARASCSSHVLLRQAGATDGLDLLAAAAGTPAGPAERPKPCTGAFCTGNPGLPEVPSTAVTPGHHDWGLLAEPLAPPAPHSFPRHHDDDRPRPLHVGLGVFHPPRALTPA